MKRRKIAVIAAACAFSCALPRAATAQGIGEMGGVYSSSAGQAGALHGSGIGDALRGLYGGAGGRISTPATAQPQMDAATAATYAADANHNYLQGLQAQKAGKLDDALKFFSKSVATRERIWGSADPAIVQIASIEAAIYEKRQNWNEMENCYRKMLLGQSHQFGAINPKLEKTITKLCWLCEKQGKSREAGALYKQLADIKSHQPNADIAEVKRLQLKEYESFSKARDFATAEPLLQIAISQEEKSNADPAYTAKLLQCYATVLRGTNRTTEADAMDVRGKAMQAASAPASNHPVQATSATASVTTTTSAGTPNTVKAPAATATAPATTATAPASTATAPATTATVPASTATAPATTATVPATTAAAPSTATGAPSAPTAAAPVK